MLETQTILLSTAYMIIGFSLSFVFSRIFLSKIITFHKNIGLVGKDINKPYAVLIPESGGIALIFSQVMALSLILILDKATFKLINDQETIKLLILMLSASLMSVIGYLEDLTQLLRKNNEQKKKGFKQKYKILLPLIPALPVIFANFDKTTITLWGIGTIDLGLLYPLVLIPIGIIGATNATNMLGGLNGLETILGIITIGGLSIYAYHVGNTGLALFGIIFLGGLVAFYLFNKYPAKIFPGDSITYLIGFVIGGMAIIGDMEKFAVTIFAIWFLELILKARGKFKMESFGKPTSNNTLKKPYKEIYSLTHIFMNGKLTERQIVRIIAIIQAFIVIVALIIYW